MQLVKINAITSRLQKRGRKNLGAVGLNILKFGQCPIFFE